MSGEPKALVTYKVHGAVAQVTLDNPRRRNAITVPMVEQLVGIFDGLEADPSIGAVVISGAGQAFCAGADLGHLVGASAGDERAERALRSIYEAFLRIYSCPLPTIAAVNGPAVGAGMNMALVCDVRLAGASALFSTRFLSLALHPGGGHTWLLRQAVGPQACNAAVLFAEDLSGPEAERVGLAWRCVSDETLSDVTLELAMRAAETSRGVAERAKQSIREMATVGAYPDSVEVEITKQLWSAVQEEFQQRMRELSPAGRAKSRTTE